MTEAAPRACPRTGRSRALPLPAGGVRPSDMLVAFFAFAVAWFAAAATAAGLAFLGDVEQARWVALHLAFVGGGSQLILGAAQFFVCAFLATDPPSKRTIRAELGLWNAGTIFVAVGVPAGVTPLTGVGGTLLIAALVMFAGALRAMRRRSLQRAPWATRWYLAAASALTIGAGLGPLIAAGTAWPRGSLLGAHLTLNLGGWFGTAIVGTLHTFYPSLTGTRLRHPRLERLAFASWTGGVAVLAASLAFSVELGAVAGWALLLAAATALAVNLLASARSAQQRSAASKLVGGAQPFLVAATLGGLVLTVDGSATAALLGEQRIVVAAPALAGWIGLTVAGSLLHLLALMARVRRLERPARPAVRERVPLLAGLAVVAGVLGVAAGLGGGAVVLVCGGYAVLGSRIAVLAVRAIRAAPVRV